VVFEIGLCKQTDQQTVTLNPILRTFTGSEINIVVILGDWGHSMSTTHSYTVSYIQFLQKVCIWLVPFSRYSELFVYKVVIFSYPRVFGSPLIKGSPIPTRISPRSLISENRVRLCGVVCVMRSLAVLLELRLVIDIRTDENGYGCHLVLLKCQFCRTRSHWLFTACWFFSQYLQSSTVICVFFWTPICP